MEPSSNCINLIKKWEGCYLAAYRDPVQIWTIGWGSITNIDTGKEIKEGDVISQETADRWLLAEIKEKASYVDSLNLQITQNQFDALTSFAYNCGTGALGGSTLLKKLKAGDIQGAADQFDLWIHGNPGEVLPGLVSRRAEEKKLFLSNAVIVPPVTPPIPDKVTLADVDWLEFTRNEVGDSVLIAYAGAEPKVLLTTNNKSELIKFFNDYPGAKTVRVSPAGKKVPKIGYTRGDETTPTSPATPTPKPMPPSTWGAKLAAWYASDEGYRTVYQDVMNWFGTTSQACVAFASTALRFNGVNNPMYKLVDGEDSSLVTLPFSKLLGKLGWIRIANADDLLPGDVVFTQENDDPGYPAHTYVFHSWINKQIGSGYVIDNQGNKHERNIKSEYGTFNFTPFAYAYRHN